jgi:LL-diaminopimelate aminotransferase
VAPANKAKSSNAFIFTESDFADGPRLCLDIPLDEHPSGKRPKDNVSVVGFPIWICRGNPLNAPPLMALLNHHYLKLRAGYLFPEIARRVNAFCEAHPDAAQSLIRCGIGDVTEPLPSAAVKAMHAAVDELGVRTTFRGYGPEQGYDFLRKAIATHDYRARNLEVAPEEIFVSDGSKCDTGNILDILSPKNVIGVPDPVYPVYVDTNVMAGHTGDADESGAYAGLHYLRGTPENGFVPEVPKGAHLDVVYLCFPNNPTGSVATRAQLTRWVEYAREHQALILFDAAYEAYISDPQIPHSIYEIDGARECAIEFRSFSKNGGFTGTRCAFTVVPKSVLAQTPDGARQPLHPLWLRRMTTKFNGVSYIVQRGAEALYSEQGKAEVAALLAHYMGNAAVLRAALRERGLDVWGGVNAPYLWARTPSGIGSWEFFDQLLRDAHVVITPGSGFGSAGEGFFRISAFNSRDNVEEVARRLTGKK